MHKINNILKVSSNTIVNIAKCSQGSIRSAGGKWAELQKAREGQYFQKRNTQYLKFIKDNLKKGKKIEDIIKEAKELDHDDINSSDNR